MEVVMPAITTLSFAAADHIGRALIAFGRTLAVYAKRLDRAMRNRQAARVLARFDDRMLADIGLNRADLRDAYAQSVWDDPTNLLRARARERRLARHGITHGLAQEKPLAPALVPKVDNAIVSQARLAFCNCS
jgi:uncharacterized protein YjiS (DUF1127 family)